MCRNKETALRVVVVVAVRRLCGDSRGTKELLLLLPPPPPPPVPVSRLTYSKKRTRLAWRGVVCFGIRVGWVRSGVNAAIPFHVFCCSLLCVACVPVQSYGAMLGERLV